MTDRKVIERASRSLGRALAAEGTPTEVYSRIVGYYRSVRNWNAGKREEYNQRLAFSMPAASAAIKAPPPELGPGGARPAAVALQGDASLRDGVLVFTREACPNCSPFPIMSSPRA